MVYTYTPTYYSSLHDSILSLCKSILPFKKKRLPAGNHGLAKIHSDNLKWQQDSFHQMMNLMGLQKDGILVDHEVSAFRVHVLDTLIAAPPKPEHPAILRDKLVFLQELFCAKCISQEEYHASKRPLLQRLAVQGAEIDARDVTLGGQNVFKNNSDEEFSVSEFKDEHSFLKKDSSSYKNNSVMKQVKGAVSVLSHVSPYKLGKNREAKSVFDSVADNLKSGRPAELPSPGSAMKELYSSTENPFWNVHFKEKESGTKSILKSEPLKEIGRSTKAKRKPFRTLFLREHKEENGRGSSPKTDRKVSKSAKKQSCQKKYSEDETAPLPLNCISDSEGYLSTSQDVACPKSPSTNQVTRKLQFDGSASDLFTDKISSSKIKKESKEHVGQVEKPCCISTQWTTFDEETEKHNISTQWTTFDDDAENFHPNLFASTDHYFAPNQQNCTDLVECKTYQNYRTVDTANYFGSNPFLRAEGNANKSTSSDCQDYNPFWTSSHNGSSLLS